MRIRLHLKIVPIFAVALTLSLAGFGRAEAQQEHDAGVWIRLESQGSGNDRCPERIYLGGQGRSYAEGIRRTGNFRPYAAGSVAVEERDGGLIYRAQLKKQYTECELKGEYETQIFQGERYTYRFSGGEISLLVEPGASLSLEHLSVYKIQPVFIVREDL